MNRGPTWRTLAGFGAAAVASIVMVAPFFTGYHSKPIPPGSAAHAVPMTHDMAQHISVLEQFDAAIRSGALYPRWQHEFNNGYGLPWLNYYPPGFYYFAEIFVLTFTDAMRALFAVCFVMMFASAVAFYALSRVFFSRLASAIAALLYTVTPYHTVDLYWRGALPELTGFVFVPLVLYFAFRCGQSGRTSDIAWLGLVHGAYLMTHFPVAYLTTITVAALAVAWTAAARQPRIAVRIGTGLALSLVVSAAYWLAALQERPYVREPFSGIFPYHASYLTLMRGDEFAVVVDNGFIALALALVISVFLLSGRTTQSAPQQRLLTWFAAGTIFMVTPYSIYIAKLIPNINAISFAWRWLVIASCFVALVVAMAIDARGAQPLPLVALALAIAFNVYGSVLAIDGALHHDRLFAPLNRQEFGFLPNTAVDPPSLPETEKAIAQPRASIDIRVWLPLRRELVVTAPSESIVRLKTLSFPGWRAWVDGKRTPISADANGAQLISVPRGTHRIEVRFGRTHARNVANATSIAGLLMALTMIVYDKRRGRRALLALVLFATGCATSSPAPRPAAEHVAVILVPGITGSRLCSATTGALLWGTTQRLIRPWDGGLRLALPLDGSADDVRPCGVIREMRVAQWKKDIYGGLLSFLQKNGYVEGDIRAPAAGANLYAFDHDWRRDNLENARLLVGLLRKLTAARHDTRVDLICQSNGGYICRYAARYGELTLEDAERGATPPASGVRIEKMILIGNANGGAMRILKELNRGRQYFRLIGRRWSPEALFTFGSLYEDLPAYRSDLFVDGRNRPMTVDVFDAANWKKYQWSIYSPSVRRRIRFGTAAERDVYLERSLDRARRMHALLRADFTGALPRMYSIQSRELATPGRAQLIREASRWRTEFAASDPGDRHATEESQNALSNSEKAALVEPTIYVTGKHFEMITTPGTRQRILNILTQ